MLQFGSHAVVEQSARTGTISDSSEHSAATTVPLATTPLERDRTLAAAVRMVSDEG